MDDNVGAFPLRESPTESVIVEITSSAKTPIERTWTGVFAIAKQVEIGINRRSKIILTSIALIPGLQTAINLVRRQIAGLRQRKQQLPISGRQRAIVEFAHRLLRLIGRKTSEIVTMQDGGGITAGLAGAEDVFLNLGVGCPGR